MTKDKKVTRSQKRKELKIKKEIIKKTDLTICDVLKLQFLIAKSLKELCGRSHFWALHVLTTIKDSCNNYQKTLKKHKDYEAYTEALSHINKEDIKAVELLQREYQDYATYFKELQKESANVSIRKFNITWLKDGTTSELTSSLLLFDLIENPEDIEKLLDE